MAMITESTLLYASPTFLTLLTHAFLNLFQRHLFVLPLLWGNNGFDMLGPRVIYRPAKNEYDGRSTASAFIMSASPGKRLTIDSAHKVMISLKRAMPRMDAATPRTAEEIMCVIGDVTWIDRAQAMESRNPTLP